MWPCCCVHITASHCRPHFWCTPKPCLFMICPSKSLPEALCCYKDGGGPLSDGLPWSRFQRSSRSANSSQDPLQIFDFISSLVWNIGHAGRLHAMPRLQSCTQRCGRCTRACAHAPESYVRSECSLYVPAAAAALSNHITRAVNTFWWCMVKLLVQYQQRAKLGVTWVLINTMHATFLVLNFTPIFLGILSFPVIFSLFVKHPTIQHHLVTWIFYEEIRKLFA